MFNLKCLTVYFNFDRILSIIWWVKIENIGVSSCPHSYIVGCRIPNLVKVEGMGILLISALSAHFFLR